MKYYGLNVSITGGSGFIGSHLVNHLVSEGATVFILCRDKLNNGIFNFDQANVVYGNATQKDDIDYFIERSKPDIFIHLAAQTQALYSMDYPYETMLNNTVSTLNILESLSRYKRCDRILIASSDKSYGELLADEYTEEHVLGGEFPYDASKSVTDIFAKTYRKISGLNIVSVRHCNVYGPGDLNFQRILPAIAKSYLQGKDFILRNSGKDVREYIYIADVLDSYDSILEYMKTNRDISSFNLGSGDRLSSLDLFNLLNDNLNLNITAKLDESSNGEINKQIMNYDLIKFKTGWEPKHSAIDWMPYTFRWYLNWLTRHSYLDSNQK